MIVVASVVFAPGRRSEANAASLAVLAETRAGRVTVVRDQIDTALSGMSDYVASLGISVDRVAFRDGCMALIGTAR